MSVVVPLFLLAPLVLVPLGYRLLDIVAPGSRPSAVVLRLLVPAAGLLVVAFWLPAGVAAAVLSLPWLAATGSVAVAAGLRSLRDPGRLRPNVRHATDAAVAFLAVGAFFAFMDRLGAQPFGFSTTIILLTAVHFHFAGFVLPLAGALACSRRPSRWLELAFGAVVVGIPVTALGFLGLPLANWIGAVLTAVGGFGIGLATLAIARTLVGRPAIVLAFAAGGSLLASMPLAVIYATGTLTHLPWLSIDLMARVHGGLNALGFALPAMIAWTLDRRARAPMAPAHTGEVARDPRRLGLAAAAIIVGYAGVLALVASNANPDEIGPPAVMSRWSVFMLLMLPGAIAAIGAWRRARALLTTAGVLCLAQAFIAFSGATIPFAVPGILLLALGSSTGGPIPRRAVVGAVGIIVLGIGSWFALLGSTETVCWVARVGADGAYIYTQIPVSDTLTVGVGEVAAGCDGGATTVQGVALGGILAIGAIAIAELSSRRARTTSDRWESPE